MQSFSSVRRIFSLASREYGRFNIGDKSASLAYRALFALSPVLILTTSIANLSIFGSLTTAGIAEFFTRYFGTQSAAFFENILERNELQSVSILVGAIGFVLIIYGAIGFFLTMQRSLFDIFAVSLAGKHMVKNFLRTYFYSFLYLALFLFFIISLFVARYFLVSGIGFVEEFINYTISAATIRALTAFLMLVLLTFFLSVSYRFFSRYTIKIIDAFIGGFAAAILILLLNNLLGIYFSFLQMLTLYGAAAFLVTMLLWVYFFSMILFSGALVAKNVAKM